MARLLGDNMSELYRHKVTITRLQKVEDPLGGWTEQPVEIGGFWAAISPVNADTRVQYMQLQVRVTHSVYIRGSADIRAGDIVDFGNRKLKVQGVLNPSEVGKHLELVCEEVNPQG